MCGIGRMEGRVLSKSVPGELMKHYSGSLARLVESSLPPARALGYSVGEPMERQHEHFGHQIKALRLSWKIGGMLPCAVPGIDTVRLREESTDRSPRE